ncbi:MAG: redox-sensing transcriptional repressor Rex [Acidobacteriota bacterium]|jgi:redox-sensing transcriptional repressor
MAFKRYIPVESISELTINRLSVYLRCLQQLELEGVMTVSSQELADRFHLNSAQIRKDLAYFGEFGIRGVGYNVAQLREHLINILGLDEERRVLVVGAGNLGIALSHYSGFNTGGFRIVAVLDADPHKVGKRIPGGLAVEPAGDLARIVKERRVHIAVITVPATSAQRVYDELVEAGVQAVLNFAPTQLKGHPEVKLKSVDLKINLELLSFFLSHASRMASVG